MNHPAEILLVFLQPRIKLGFRIVQGRQPRGMGLGIASCLLWRYAEPRMPMKCVRLIGVLRGRRSRICSLIRICGIGIP